MPPRPLLLVALTLSSLLFTACAAVEPPGGRRDLGADASPVPGPDAGADAAPTCDRSSATCPIDQPVCGPAMICEGCAEDVDCAGFVGAAHCGRSGACVACADASQCPGATPVCDADSEACRTCARNAECASGVCDPAGTCVDEATIVYVSPAGAPTSQCTQAEPCALERAVAMTTATRATILLADATYAASISLAGARSVTLVGSRAVTLRSSGTQAIVAVAQGAALTVRGLTLDVSSRGVVCASASIRVEDTRFLAHSSGPLLRSDACLTVVQRAEFDAGGTTGAQAIAVFPSGSMLVNRSTFHGFVGAIFVRQVAVTITNSIFSGAPGAASDQITSDSTIATRPLFIGYNTFVDVTLTCPANVPTTVTGNIIVDSLGQAPRFLASGTATVTNNLMTPAPFSTVGTGNISGDPQFVDVAGGDFRLVAGSPAIDAAIDDVAIAVDHDGAPRPTGGHSDMGAFEWQW